MGEYHWILALNSDYNEVDIDKEFKYLGNMLFRPQAHV